ncbi:Ion channel [Rubrobacter radiotolerans]|uniref:Ion channel n=1 Tax=Rubrobacter radiotolerans TaxID=42256 RepID=A0A023X0E7_RUBRA|nr:potassium channel family protein [Rubrobacter radiotolerans]AHY45818.1 Ion channel [Rubrobacter radiotolerans]MDX5893232.1 potassium channel family protein [Rubrobacter radiotolerans]SMC03328.1 Ion channel [Rubrobacter radiotolerans DSM 5868]
MIPFVTVLYRLVRAFIEAWREPHFRGLFYLVFLTLASGTIFYHNVEGWTYFDAFYFSVITLTTVGYGDLVPTTTYGRLFTVFYIFLGIGLILAFIDAVAKPALTRSSRPKEPRRTRRRTETEDAGPEEPDDRS